jgi:hypothetical protein
MTTEKRRERLDDRVTGRVTRSKKGVLGTFIARESNRVAYVDR